MATANSPGTLDSDDSSASPVSNTLRDIQNRQYQQQTVGPDQGFAPVPMVHPSVQLQQANSKPANGKPVPHFLSKTTLHRDKLFRVLFGMSLVVNFVYFAVRIVYIALGRVKVQPPEDATDEQMERVQRQNDAAVVYSIIVICAELGGFILVHIGQQMFTKQETVFAKMTPDNVDKMAMVCQQRGKLQRIHTIVCTYSEDAIVVERCVQHLLDSPLPVYAERTIYVADDGHAKPEGKEKRAFVERMRAAGQNVVYVGDRIRKKGQLNGKSSNLNHVILNKVYPDVSSSAQISWKDIIMVMDCDHLVREEFFQKCCAVMLDKDVAVCLVPQAFHNAIYPDMLDNTNINFMFRLMPYYFGAGCCFITGTNVMIRARACFLACKFGEQERGRRSSRALESGRAGRSRQLFSEVLVAEDVDLGSRVHALGYKSVFLNEVLARGEVPLGPRDFWKQRARWAKAAHLYILDPRSVFWHRQKHMSLYQKSLYCVPFFLHFCIFFTEPIMFTLPFICVVTGVCPYGIDLWLWLTHFFRLVLTFFLSTHADTISKRISALHAQTSSRVLYFVNVKAVLNTIMIGLRWKKPGAFKVTKKGSAPPAPRPQPIAEADSDSDSDSSSGGSAFERAVRAAEQPLLRSPAPTVWPSQPVLEYRAHIRPATAHGAVASNHARKAAAGGIAEGAEPADIDMSTPESPRLHSKQEQQHRQPQYTTMPEPQCLDAADVSHTSTAVPIWGSSQSSDDRTNERTLAGRWACVASADTADSRDALQHTRGHSSSAAVPAGASADGLLHVGASGRAVAQARVGMKRQLTDIDSVSINHSASSLEPQDSAIERVPLTPGIGTQCASPTRSPVTQSGTAAWRAQTASSDAIHNPGSCNAAYGAAEEPVSLQRLLHAQQALAQEASPVRPLRRLFSEGAPALQSRGNPLEPSSMRARPPAMLRRVHSAVDTTYVPPPPAQLTPRPRVSDTGDGSRMGQGIVHLQAAGFSRGETMPATSERLTVDQTKKVALMRRVPSRHVWSSTTSSDLEGGSGVSGGLHSFSHSRGAAAPAHAASPGKRFSGNGGTDSSGLGPGLELTGLIPEEGEHEVLFDPVTAELSGAALTPSSLTQSPWLLGVGKGPGALGPPSLIEEASTPDEADESAASNSASSAHSSAACAAPVPVPTSPRRVLHAAGPIPEGYRGPSDRESPARIYGVPSPQQRCASGSGRAPVDAAPRGARSSRTPRGSPDALPPPPPPAYAGAGSASQAGAYPPPVGAHPPQPGYRVSDGAPPRRSSGPHGTGMPADGRGSRSARPGRASNPAPSMMAWRGGGMPYAGGEFHTPRGDRPAPEPELTGLTAGLPRQPNEPNGQGDAAQDCGLYVVHDKLSAVTEKRKACMPWEGTLDFWVLAFVTVLNLFTVAYGLVNAGESVFSLRGTEQQNIELIALVFALVEATPGVLFMWYIASYKCCKYTLFFWVPTVITIVAILMVFIEFRVGLQYVTSALGINWQLPDCDFSGCEQTPVSKTDSAGVDSGSMDTGADSTA